MKTRMPDVKDVAREIRALAKEVARYGAFEGGEPPELRLQVYPDGTWALRWGLSDYDLDHRGFWGAAYLPRPREKASVFESVARSLIEQATEQAAYAGALEEEEA
jgi:hypothetical protein